MRCVGTVVRGIRTPIIKEKDDLANIVIDSLMKASESEGFNFHDKDVVAITEAVVGISEGNYVTVDDIANDVKVVTSERLMKNSLALSRAESGTVNVNEERLISTVATPLLKIIVNARGKILASLHSDNTELCVN